jgi:hypothetical protein
MLRKEDRVWLGAYLAASRHICEHTSREFLRTAEMAFGDVFPRFSTASHLVWGSEVPDFCCVLVAALAEE